LEGIILKRMSYGDLSEVYAIETRCFTSPWSLGSFRYELGHNQSILKVALLSERIVGYVCVRAMHEDAHILNLAVLPELRRRGIGSALLQDALEELRTLKPQVKFVTLEVRESNIPAIRLYEKFGFNIIGKRHNYYHMPDEDAVTMGKRIEPLSILRLPAFQNHKS